MACMKLLLAFTFLISCLQPSHFTAQGREFPNAHAQHLKKEEMGVKMRSLIGSRPPKCDGRCRNCGHCEAVQVPIAPALKFLNENQDMLYGRVEYSRGDDISSYKPMCWKCKCGDFFFSP